MCTSAAAEGSAPIRLSIPERARTIASISQSGTLCTQSTLEDGRPVPFGSYVDYILDENGWPVLLLSSESLHTKNMDKSSLVSLFCHTPKLESNEQAASLSWVTVTGEVQDIAAESLAPLKLAFSVMHPYAETVAETAGFRFRRVKPLSIFFSGGFGVHSSFVGLDAYQKCRADVIAQEVPLLLAKVNTERSSDMTTLAKNILGVSSKLEAVKMVGFDRLGVDVRVSTGVSTDEYRVGFRNPVASVEDAKSELTKLFQEAWERENNCFPGKDLPVIDKYAEDVIRHNK